MSDNVAPLVPPTPGEAEEIMQLTQGLDAVLQMSTSGTTAMSAITSIVVSFTAQCEPGKGREELVADVELMLTMVKAMGDKVGDEALDAAAAVAPMNSWSDHKPVTH